MKCKVLHLKIKYTLARQQYLWKRSCLQNWIQISNLMLLGQKKINIRLNQCSFQIIGETVQLLLHGSDSIIVLYLSSGRHTLKRIQGNWNRFREWGWSKDKKPSPMKRDWRSLEYLTLGVERDDSGFQKAEWMSHKIKSGLVLYCLQKTF